MPTLTAGGRVAEILGFLSAMIGINQDQRALLLLGMVLLVPVAYSWIAVWIQGRALEVRVERPTTARALEPSPVLVAVTARTSVPSVLVRDARRPRVGLLLHLDRLRPGEHRRVRGREVHTRRGRVQPGPLSLQCSRPFGLACAQRLEASRSSLVVLPAIGSLSAGFMRRLSRGGPQGLKSTRQPGYGGDIRTMRAFLPGDSHRHIHWPTTARMGEIVIREWDEDEDEGLLVVGIGWRDSTASQHRVRVEAAVSLVSTILARVRRTILLVLPDEAPRRIMAGDRTARAAAEEQLALLGDDVGWPDLRDLPEDEPITGCLLVHPATHSLPALPDHVQPFDVSELVRDGEFAPRGRPPE